MNILDRNTQLCRACSRPFAWLGDDAEPLQDRNLCPVCRDRCGRAARVANALVKKSAACLDASNPKP